MFSIALSTCLMFTSSISGCFCPMYRVVKILQNEQHICNFNTFQNTLEQEEKRKGKLLSIVIFAEIIKWYNLVTKYDLKKRAIRKLCRFIISCIDFTANALAPLPQFKLLKK